MQFYLVFFKKLKGYAFEIWGNYLYDTPMHGVQFILFSDHYVGDGHLISAQGGLLLPGNLRRFRLLQYAC